MSPNMNAYQLAVSALLQDLTPSASSDLALFHDLFYDRRPAIDTFVNLFPHAATRRQNFLIVGDAGVGKTSFVYSLLTAPDIVKDLSIEPVLVDYRTATPRSPTGCLLAFIDSMRKCFDNLGAPIHTLKDNVAANVDDNLYLIERHLVTVSPGLPRQITIFMDDFDYAEDVWYKLLDDFMPFAASPHAMVVMTMRPPLFRAIDTYDDRFSHYFTRTENDRIHPRCLVGLTKPFVSA